MKKQKKGRPKATSGKPKTGRPRISTSSKLLRLREKANIDFQYAVDQLPITKATLYKYESGQRRPGVDTARRMAALYGCSLEDIFEASGSEVINECQKCY